MSSMEALPEINPSEASLTFVESKTVQKHKLDIKIAKKLIGKEKLCLAEIPM